MKPIKNTNPKYVPRYIMIWEAQLFGIATHRDLQLMNCNRKFPFQIPKFTKEQRLQDMKFLDPRSA